MLLSEINKKFVFTTKLELPEGNYIELREPKQSEITALSDDGNKNLSMLEKIFPNCVIDSSFENDDGTKAKGEDIAKALRESGSLFTEILTTWLESIPFQSRLLKKAK